MGGEFALDRVSHGEVPSRTERMIFTTELRRWAHTQNRVPVFPCPILVCLVNSERSLAQPAVERSVHKSRHWLGRRMGAAAEDERNADSQAEKAPAGPQKLQNKAIRVFDATFYC